MIKKLFAIVAAISLAGCVSEKEAETTVIDGFAQGSTYHIILKNNTLSDAKNYIDSIISSVDKSVSVFDSTSLLSKINLNQTDSIDKYIAECITVANRVSKESNGMYDVTIKPLTAAYGFASKNKTQTPNIDSLLQYVGYEKITIEQGRLVKQNPNVQIDLNSIAQGYTVDIIAANLESVGIKEYLIELGGEIFSRGTNAQGKEWVVGIDKPIEGNITPGESLQVKVLLSGKGLATSGNYRKFYINDKGQKIVHTVNPKTGEPIISNLLSATVIAENAITADVYGTMLMTIGLDNSIKFLKSHPELAAYLIYSDPKGALRTFATQNFDDKIIK